MKKNFLMACLALAFAAESSCAGDWPMFMANERHTGVASDTGCPLAGKSAKPSWQYALNAPVSASPVVADHQLFVAAENGNLYAFDLTDRHLLWLYHTEAGIGSTPAVANGKVYFLSRDGSFNALEQATGKLLWRKFTAGEARFGVTGGYGLPASYGVVPDPWDFYLSSPLVQNGRVYFGSSDHHVYALDGTTGGELWKFDAGESIHSSPTYAKGRIFIGTYDTTLFALDANTGTELWHYQGGTDYTYGVMMGIAASPTVDETNVYVGSRDGFLYAFKQVDGKAAWASHYDASGSWILSTAAVDDNNIYFGTSDTMRFVALDKKTGKEVYHNDLHVWTYTSPVLVQNRYAFVGTMAGELYGFDKITGKKLWYYQTPEAKADANDILDDKTGALRTDKLFAADKQVQSATEYAKALGAFVASPIWADDQLIAVTATGTILSFDERRQERH